MSNRNFDNRVIIQRLKDKNYAKNLYTNNVSGLSLISNPQNTDFDSSIYNKFVAGAQTTYSQGLLGSIETVNLGGIANIPPYIQSSNSSSPATLESPVITSITGANLALNVFFTQVTNGYTITNYSYSTDGGATFALFSPSQTSSPVVITAISADGVTALTNNTSYDVIIQAVTSSATSANSNTVTATPTSNLVQFTTVGTTSWTVPTGILSVQYLIVAGGGGSGGGFDTGAGGGGGAGMILADSYSVTPGNTYTVVVGNGGTAGVSNRGPPSIETSGGNGGNSSFDIITALGGGGGRASRSTPGGVGVGGVSVEPEVSASGGGNGGGNASLSTSGSGGGGGGSSSNGSNGVSAGGGNGGSGTPNSITGSTVVYGVGGNGAKGNINTVATAGTNNTGNGANAGGASSSSQEDGAVGGSGIVVLLY